MKITHVSRNSSFDSCFALTCDPYQHKQISANFLHFVAYSTGSSSIVLIGDTETTPASEPKIIPQLQNKSVISVVLGDYHNAALTAHGKLLTWGAYSNGALGLGDPLKLPPGTPGAFSTERELIAAQVGGRPRVHPPAVDIPTEVRFDHNNKKSKERFCFSITAAGWHTGALVIDLQVCPNPIVYIKFLGQSPDLVLYLGGRRRRRRGAGDFSQLGFGGASFTSSV